MKTEELKASADKHFKANPKVEKYFVTADGQCFEVEHNAINHSKTLGSKEIIEIKKEIKSKK